MQDLKQLSASGTANVYRRAFLPGFIGQVQVFEEDLSGSKITFVTSSTFCPPNFTLLSSRSPSATLHQQL
jgi:hypothetical protein